MCLIVARACEEKEPAKEKKPGSRKKINTQNIWLVLGTVLIIFSAVGLPDSIQYLVWCMNNNSGISYALEDLIRDSIWLVCGIGMLFISLGMRSASKKRRRIVAVVGDADHISIDEVAAALPASHRKTAKMLQRCIDFGMFGEKAYLDMRSDCLVVRGEAPISKKAKAAAENLDEYERILKELRDLNERIPGEEMSAKISRLEDLTGKIFKIAKEQPKKLGSMRKFMDYYLPTSLKLLRGYAELDAQGVEGTNISDSKRKIEDTMDMMVTAFEKQLDKMFLSESIDISADIAAMQNLMRADGLVENEFLEEIQSVE